MITALQRKALEQAKKELDSCVRDTVSLTVDISQKKEISLEEDMYPLQGKLRDVGHWLESILNDKL